jgi:hypothetical protein
MELPATDALSGATALGTIDANSEGIALASFSASRLSLDAENSIVGHAVVVLPAASAIAACGDIAEAELAETTDTPSADV